MFDDEFNVVKKPHRSFEIEPKKIEAAPEKKFKFFDKVKTFLPFLNPSLPKESNLTGRIYAEIKKDAHQRIEQLKNLKQLFKEELKEGDEDLWQTVEAVIDPLVREYHNIEEKLQKDATSPTAESIFSYTQWVEKTKLWAPLHGKSTDRLSIIETVVIQTMFASELVIDRDLKTLQDYVAHEVRYLKDQLGLVEKVAKEIDIKVGPYIKGLIELKKSKPEDLQLEHLQQWKSDVDQARSEYYEEALEVIDSIIGRFVPDKSAVTKKSEHEHEHLKEVFATIALLEEKVPKVLQELEKATLEEKTILKDKLLKFEDQVHTMNGNLRLTPELEERVLVLMEEIAEALKRF